MASQRVLALLFLVVICVFFTWEKAKLQQQAAEDHRAQRRRAAVQPTTRGPTVPRASPIPKPPTAAPSARPGWPPASSTDPAPADPLLAPLSYVTIANVSATCPLPVLQPSKFQAKMGWGERKTYPSCVPSGGLFARVVSTPGGDVVRVDTERCGGSLRVHAFGELEDKDFRRLTSTYDAEARQNELRERFSDPSAFAALITPQADGAYLLPPNAPYAVVDCGDKRQLVITAPKPRAPPAAARDVQEGGIKDFLHIMIDSTSIYALRRSAKRVVQWLEKIDRDPHGAARVHAMKHYHAVSCCSPGNQIPMYAGNMNGEGDFFINSEPLPSSRDWLWNIARDRGFRTFWSLDNCPDKSARDYHAYPNVDSRVVAPICLAGVLLSHQEATCLGGKFIDAQVIDGLESFWAQHPNERKFAAVQFITPHEDSEKLLIEVDVVLAEYFERLETAGALNHTAIVFWSDHGINFGKYASTHDGEIEKMFPFANVILPRWVNDTVHRNLRRAVDRLTTPYDLYEVSRALLHYPRATPPFAHDPANPPLPRPADSHIMASFQKTLTPVDLTRATLPEARSCWDANIPMEFCTCIPWRETKEAKYGKFVDLAVKEHTRLLAEYTSGAHAKCHPFAFEKTVSTMVQKWPEEYKPKGKDTAKSIWMKPNRDMVRVEYESAQGPGHGLFAATFSVDKKTGATDLAHIDRLDAMTKKCGVTEKVREQLCVCR